MDLNLPEKTMQTLKELNISFVTELEGVLWPSNWTQLTILTSLKVHCSDRFTNRVPPLPPLPSFLTALEKLKRLDTLGMLDSFSTLGPDYFSLARNCLTGLTTLQIQFFDKKGGITHERLRNMGRTVSQPEPNLAPISLHVYDRYCGYLAFTFLK